MRCVSCRRLVVSASVCADRKVLGCEQFSRGAVMERVGTVGPAGSDKLGGPVLVSRWRPAICRRSRFPGPLVSVRGRNVRRLGCPELICVSSLRRLPAGALSLYKGTRSGYLGPEERPAVARGRAGERLGPGLPGGTGWRGDGPRHPPGARRGGGRKRPVTVHLSAAGHWQC